MANLTDFEETIEQKRPFFISLLLITYKAIDLQKKTGFRRRFANFFKQYQLGLVIWLLILLVWFFVWRTGIGLIPDDRFWNIAGVPFLPLQIIGVVLSVFLLIDIRSLLHEKKVLQRFTFGKMILIAFGFWAVAVVVWQREPLFHTYFSPGPYLPNEVHYPFSDAMSFDIVSQYLIMGRGFQNGGFTERPFLQVFFGLLHLLAGQDYDQVMFVQILFLGLIPAFMFLIGRQLHSQIAGIAMGILGIVYGKNAIASASTAGITNPKVMMSELPTALLLVILSYCVIRWFQKNGAIWAVYAGGVLGLAIGVRGNVLIVVPFILASIVLHYLVIKTGVKDLTIKLSLFILAMFLVVAPYSIETTNKFGDPFFLPKIRTVIERAGRERLEAGQVKLQKLLPNLRSDQEDNQAGFNSNPASSINSFGLPEGLIDYTTRHFLHNQITAVLIFPLEYRTVDLNEVTAKPFWDGTNLWKGALLPGETVLLAGYLLVISLGLGYAIKTWQVSGAIPAIVHLSYQLANGLARTSGGRYLAPTNWVLILYFCLGFVALVSSLRKFSVRSITSTPGKLNQSIHSSLIVLSLVLFLGVGASYLLFEQITPEYALVSESEASNMLQEMDWASSEYPAEVSTNIENLLSSEEAVIEMGLALYPRYYQPGEENPRSTFLPQMETDSSRIYFILLTDDGPLSVNLIWGDQKLKTFPHAEYGFLLGHQKKDYIEGYLFVPISTPEQELFYTQPFPQE